MNLSLICPAYNEEQTIAQTLTEAREALLRQPAIDQFEIIVVDDGSKDKTRQEAAKINDTRIIQNIKNLGYGASLKRGIKEAKYDWLLIVDGDGTYPLDALNLMLGQVKDHAMVVGERDLKLFEYPIMRRLAKGILKTLVYLMTGQKIKDLNSGLRLIRKDAVEIFLPIISDGFSFTTTLTLAFYQNSFPIAYVPINYRKRSSGKSKIHPFRDTFQIFTLIFRTIMFFQPLRIFTFIAFVFFGLTAISLTIDIFMENITDKSILFFTAASAFFFAGLIADLIHRKFDLLEKKLEQVLKRESNGTQERSFQESGKGAKF